MSAGPNTSKVMRCPHCGGVLNAKAIAPKVKPKVKPVPRVRQGYKVKTSKADRAARLKAVMAKNAGKVQARVDAKAAKTEPVVDPNAGTIGA